MKSRFLAFAEITDALRIFPRICLAWYGLLCWKTFEWYRALPAPTGEQTAFATAIIGLAVPLTAFYMQTGRRWAGQ